MLDTKNIVAIEAEQEWRWCLVGNIVESHTFGEEKEIRYGSKHFAPGTKVYMAPAHWGDGYEDIIVIGKPRHRQNYIQIIMKRELIENCRLQKVYKPIILKMMKNSELYWWDDSDKDRDRIISLLEWLNPAEAEKAKLKIAECEKNNTSD